MATPYAAWCREQKRDPQRGDVIYWAGTPQNPVAVVAVVRKERHTREWMLRVRPLRGDHEDYDAEVSHFNSLDALIAETEKKLANHRERRAYTLELLDRDSA